MDDHERRCVRADFHEGKGYVTLTHTPGRYDYKIPPSISDVSMLDRFAYRLLTDRCHPDEIELLSKWFDNLPNRRNIKMCTLCSGTDSPVLAMNGIVSAISHVTGKAVSNTTRFSCDVKRSSRIFIMNMFPDTKHVYEDVLEVARVIGTSEPISDHAPSSKQHISVVPADAEVVIAGFPCKDVSRCNIQASSNRDVIANRSGTTGSCFDAVVKVCATLATLEHLKFVVLENVIGLSSQLAEVTRRLEEIGLIVRVYSLCPYSHFGWPQRRPRFWILCIARTYLNVCRDNETKVLKYMDETMCGFVGGHGSVAPENVLLPEDHPAIRTYINDLLTGPSMLLMLMLIFNLWPMFIVTLLLLLICILRFLLIFILFVFV